MIPLDDENDAYLTTGEVAEMLGVHKSYISVLRGRGDSLPSFRFGRVLLTRRSTVINFLAQEEHADDV
jgi:excisionase family DNA binding protein